MKRHIIEYLALVLVLICPPVLMANDQPAPEVIPAPSSSEASASAAASAAAIASLRAQLEQSQRQLQGQRQSAEGVGSVDVGGDQNAYESKALALSLPGLVAAPAVPGECLEHLRGYGALSAGVTGRTKLNDQCLARQHCLSLADRLASWNQIEAAVRQLQTCGGVPGGPSAQKPPDLSQYMRRDEMRARDQRLIETVTRK